MKANELRIGNLIYLNEELIKFGFSILKFDDLNNIKPIPLTEEWLVRFGFKRDNKYDFTLNVKDVGEFYTSSEWFHGNGYITFEHFGIKLFYLHQLQNLYFALTGEELTQSC